MKRILAWHFLREDGRLNYPPHTKVKVGGTVHSKGALLMCENGLHASERIIDALQYAPGALACRVELWGNVIHDTDKMVGQHRHCLWMVNANEILWAFARRCVLDAIHLWDAPDVVKEFSQTGNEELRAASWTAYSAAFWDASWAAFYRATSWTASRAASWEASRDASWTKYNGWLTEMVEKEREK